MSTSSKKKSTKINNNEFDNKLEDIIQLLQNNYQQQKQLMNELKELKMSHAKEIKVASGQSVKKSGKNSGFNKPQPVPLSLRKLLQLDDEELPRSTVTSLMYQYFQTNNMCNTKTGREIQPNRKIKTIFGMNDDDIMNFYNLQTWLKKVYQEHAINENILEL